MAHFANINDNVVRQIIVVNNEVLENKSFPESEPIGIAFCKSLYGAHTEWLQTSYNNNFRKNYAGVGMTYDATRDAFIAPQCHSSATLNEDTCSWTCSNLEHTAEQ